MNDTHNTDMIEFWNGEAGQKWVRLQETLDSGLQQFGDRAMAAAAVAPGDRVIDVGCGCGSTSLRLSAAVGSAGRVLGVDISRPMLARAAARAADTRASDNGTIEFELADAQSHDFEAGAFDVVFSRFGVMFFADPVAAFENLKSALKPGGRLAFVCWRPAKQNHWISLPMKVVAEHIPLPAPPGPEDPGEFAFGDDVRIKRILAGAGFTDVAVETFDTTINPGGGGTLDDTVAFYLEMGPVARAIAGAGADEAVKTKLAADLRDALAPHHDGETMDLGAATWIVTARHR